MKVIGINTATTDLSLALVEDNKVLQEISREGPTAKAEQLIPWLDNILKQEGLAPRDIEGIGVAQGPGAFTGLRIGVTTAKTLAQTLEVPLVGISTLEAFAHQFIQNNGKILRIILNACRGELNTALFKINNNGLAQLEKDHPENIEELIKKIKAEDSLLAGDVPEEFSSRTLKERPHAASLAFLAIKRIKENKLDDPKTLYPVYSHGPNIKFSPRIHGKLIKK